MKKVTLLLVSLIFYQTAAAQLPIDSAAYLQNNKLLYAIVVSKNNQVVYNRYFNKQAETTLFNNQSLTKSVVSLLIGIAIEKGNIKSVDQKVSDFFPELKKDKDKRKMEITIRQIMDQTSGFYHEEQDVSKLFDIKNLSSHVLKADLVANPGEMFQYNNAASHLLSAIITKSTGMSTLSFARKFLFGPLGINHVDWKKMNDGYYDGSGLASLYLRAEDMLKIGNLVLENGKYGRLQVVSSNWIRSITEPTKTYATPWGLPDSRYSLCWYHANYKGFAIHYALGWGGQFMYIVPALKIVIVTNSSVADETAIKQAAMITHKLLPDLLRALK